MPWYLRALAVGSAVTIASFAAQRFGAFVGGMLLAFPFAIGSGLVFAALTKGGDFHATAVGALWGLIPLLAFLVVVVLLGTSMRPAGAMAIGVACWLAVAFAIYRLR